MGVGQPCAGIVYSRARIAIEAAGGTANSAAAIDAATINATANIAATGSGFSAEFFCPGGNLSAQQRRDADAVCASAIRAAKFFCNAECCPGVCANASDALAAESSGRISASSSNGKYRGDGGKRGIFRFGRRIRG